MSFHKLSRNTITMLLTTSLNRRKLFCANDLRNGVRQCSCRLLSGACILPQNGGNIWSHSPFLNLPPSVVTLSRNLSETRKNLYDVLGITPKATQKEVKAAYFNLSKVCHPDVTAASSSKESAERFRDIAEAYEVLGNSEARKQYDSQRLGRTNYDPELWHPEFRTRRPPPRGRSNIYNYDEWTRQHYSEIFDRQARELRRRRERAYEFGPDVEIVRRVSAARVFFVLCNLLFFMMLTQFIVSHYVDVPKPRANGEDTKPK